MVMNAGLTEYTVAQPNNRNYRNKSKRWRPQFISHYGNNSEKHNNMKIMFVNLIYCPWRTASPTPPPPPSPPPFVDDFINIYARIYWPPFVMIGNKILRFSQWTTTTTMHCKSPRKERVQYHRAQISFGHSERWARVHIIIIISMEQHPKGPRNDDDHHQLTCSKSACRLQTAQPKWRGTRFIFMGHRMRWLRLVNIVKE